MGDAAEDAFDAYLNRLADGPVSSCGDPECIVSDPHRRGKACYHGLFENQGKAVLRYEESLRNRIPARRRSPRIRREPSL